MSLYLIKETSSNGYTSDDNNNIKNNMANSKKFFRSVSF